MKENNKILHLLLKWQRFPHWAIFSIVNQHLLLCELSQSSRSFWVRKVELGHPESRCPNSNLLHLLLLMWPHFTTSHDEDLLQDDTKKCLPSLSGRFWRGLYNRFDRGMHPRQSVEDYLSAIQEETQQLEEQLASHKQVRQMFCCSVIKNLVHLWKIQSKI